MTRLFQCFTTESIVDQFNRSTIGKIKACTIITNSLVLAGGILTFIFGFRERNIGKYYPDENLSKSLLCKNSDLMTCRQNLTDSGQQAMEIGGWIALAAGVALSAELLYLKLKRNPASQVSVNAVEEGEDHYIPRNYGATAS